MSRKIERNMLKIIGFWQIGHGVFTILYYSIINRTSLTTQFYNTFSTSHNITNIFIFINIFGTLMMGIGLFNLVVAKNYLKDNTINKISIWLLVNGIFSYLIMDFISLVLGMSTAIIYLAKNKSIKLLLNEKASN